MSNPDPSDEAKVDPTLWFTMEPSCEGRHFLLYNSHTFPGRFTAWCPMKKRAVNVSKSDVRDCSQEAKYWLKGFLSGAEPDPPRSEGGTYLDHDSPEFQR
jgi:hypothetical protein